MNVKQRQATDLPGLIQASSDGSAITNVAYDAVGLVVSYQKNGGSVQTKLLSASDWIEGVDGSYNIRFSATELDTLGLFSFWVSYPSAATYAGAAIVESVPSIESQETLLVYMESMQMFLDELDIPSSSSIASIQSDIDSIQTAIAALPSSTSIATISSKIDSMQTAIAALPTSTAVAAIQSDIDLMQTAIAALPSSSSIATISSKIDSVQTAIAALPTSTAVAAIQSDIDSMQTAIAALPSSTAVAAIQSDIDSIQSAIAALPSSSDLSDITTAINGLNSVVASSAAVAAISSKIDSVQTAITALPSSTSIAAIQSDIDLIQTAITTLPTNTSITAISSKIDSVQTTIAALPTSTAIAAIQSDIDSIQSAIAALPSSSDLAAITTAISNVASSTSVAAIQSDIDSMQTAIATLLSNNDLTTITTAINNLNTVVASLPTDVASSASVAALQSTIEGLFTTGASLTIGYSINVTQHKATWLPVRLISKTTGTGNIGVQFNEIIVKYQKSGGAVMTKTLTADQWSEGANGSYSIFFTSTELNILGTIGYWIEHIGSVTYPGMALVIEAGAGPGILEKTIRVTVNGQPIKDCEIWVTTDIAGKDKIAGPRFTDILGVATVYIDPGDYWVHYRKAREVEYNKLKWKVTSDG